MARIVQSQPVAVNTTAGTFTISPQSYGGPQSNQRITVVSAVLIMSVAGTLQFESGSNPISGAMSLAVNGGIVLPYNPDGWFTTQPGQALNLVVGGSGSVQGTLNIAQA